MGPANVMGSPVPADKDSPITLRRRSSTLSDFSLSDARRSFRDGTQEILNPSAASSDQHNHQQQDASDAASLLSSLPLAFALLPALVGIFFEGGSSFITDVMLLGLVFIFLRYTITQPWRWYHDAQRVRSAQEQHFEHAIDEDSEDDIGLRGNVSGRSLDQVPEEDRQQDEDGVAETAPPGDVEARTAGTSAAPATGRTTKPITATASGGVTRVQEAAINELYMHEVLALVSCFVSPAIGAYLLHAIRAQLSRPSEGLMTDFNISVFLLAAELRPMSHALKLIQARTLHLQRIVQSAPVTPSMAAQLEEIQARLAQVEERAETAQSATATLMSAAASQQQQQQHQQQQRNGGTTGGGQSGSGNNRQDAALMREIRNSIQPELDALSRAMRRYEKKATVLALQTESRLGIVDTRLNDAISLAAAAAKQQRRNRPQWGVFSAFVAWFSGLVLAMVALPYHVTMYVVMWPFRLVAGFCLRSSRRNGGRSEGRALNGGGNGSASASNGHKLGRNGYHQGFNRGSRNSSGSDKDRHRDRVPSRVSRRFSP